MNKLVKIGALLLMVGSVNATMMPRKNNNSNSNQGLARVNRELGIGKKKKQVKRLVLNRKEIYNILRCDDLATFEKVAWEKVYETKDRMLKQACRNGSPKIVVHLIKEGANVDGKDEFSFIPLFEAVRFQRPKVVKVLIQTGADVNIKDEVGYTPLYETLKTGDINLAKMLIDAGVDIDSKNISNRDVIEYGLWRSTFKDKENIFKVVNFIKSVKERRDRVNAWLNEK